MKQFVGVCAACGDVCFVPDAEAKTFIDAHREDEAEEDAANRSSTVLVSRCGIVREMDGGPEECGGDVYLRGLMELDPLDIWKEHAQ